MICNSFLVIYFFTCVLITFLEATIHIALVEVEVTKLACSLCAPLLKTTPQSGPGILLCLLRIVLFLTVLVNSIRVESHLIMTICCVITFIAGFPR